MADIRVSDSSRYKDMWSAIGYALQTSADATHAMLQLAATVSGSELVQFALQEGTLGGQVKSVTAIVRRLNTNYWIGHPDVDESEKDVATRLLKSMSMLVPYRNRIAHDVWTPFSEEGVVDAIEGRRATRWSPVTVHSTIHAIHTLGFQFATAAAGLGQVDMTIGRKRAGKLGPAVLERDPAEQATKLEAAIAGMKDQTLKGWRWTEVHHEYRVTKQEVLKPSQRDLFGET